MGMRARPIAASAPISDVLAVMPSVTMSCTPMIAPITHSGAISNSDPGSRKRGCRRAAVVGLSTRSLIPDPLSGRVLYYGWLELVLGGAFGPTRGLAMI